MSNPVQYQTHNSWMQWHPRIVRVELCKVNHLREKMIFNVETFENLLQLEEKLCYTGISITVILMVNGVLNRNSHFHFIHILNFLHYHWMFGVPVLGLALNVPAPYDKFNQPNFIHPQKRRIDQHNSRILHLYGFLESNNRLHWCGDIDGEINCITHFRASVEVADWFCNQNCIRVVDFLIVIPKENGCQYIHLFHNQLHINSTQIYETISINVNRTWHNGCLCLWWTCTLTYLVHWHERIICQKQILLLFDHVQSNVSNMLALLFFCHANHILEKFPLHDEGKLGLQTSQVGKANRKSHATYFFKVGWPSIER